MAFYATCPDCAGSGLLTDPVEPCVYCDGKGYREERQKTAAELKAEVRHIERFLFEPGYAIAVLFLAGRSDIERTQRATATGR